MISIDMYKTEKEKIFFLFNAIFGGLIWGYLILYTLSISFGFSATIFPTINKFYLICFWIILFIVILSCWVAGEYAKAYIVGNSIMVNESQQPELHKIIIDISRELGIVEMPFIFIIDNEKYQNQKMKIYSLFNAFLGGFIGIVILSLIILSALFIFTNLSFSYPGIYGILISYLKQILLSIFILLLWLIAIFNELKEFPLAFVHHSCALIDTKSADFWLKRKGIKELRMILARELAHHAAGHTHMLKNFLMAPAMFLPLWGTLVGKAYRRESELSADRIGMALAGDLESSSRALVYAAYGSENLTIKANISSFINQESQLPSVSFFINDLFSNIPRITKRVLYLEAYAKMLGIPARIETRGKALVYGVAGPLTGKAIELGQEALIIGRDPKLSNLVIPGDVDFISKRHCQVRFDDVSQSFILEDLGSKNGTFLKNGQRLATGTPGNLKPGEQFYLANPGISFELRLK
jgi:Zn-dependent protease with chaperone function